MFFTPVDSVDADELVPFFPVATEFASTDTANVNMFWHHMRTADEGTPQPPRQQNFEGIFTDLWIFGQRGCAPMLDVVSTNITFCQADMHRFAADVVVNDFDSDDHGGAAGAGTGSGPARTSRCRALTPRPPTVSDSTPRPGSVRSGKTIERNGTPMATLTENGPKDWSFSFDGFSPVGDADVNALVQALMVDGAAVGERSVDLILTDADGFTSAPAAITVETVPCAFDLAVTIAVDTTTPAVGDTLTFSNEGPNAVDVAVVEITQIGDLVLEIDPASLAVDASGATNALPPSSFDPTTGIWTIGAAESGDELVLSFRAVVRSSGRSRWLRK